MVEMGSLKGHLISFIQHALGSLKGGTGTLPIKWGNGIEEGVTWSGEDSLRGPLAET